MTAIDRLDAQTVSSLLAILIPALTALVTKWNVSSTVRTLVAAFLSAAAGAVGTLVAPNGGFNWQTFALTTLYAFVVQVALYLGVYKPRGIAKAIAGATPNFGLGTTRVDSADSADSADAQDDDTEPELDVDDPDLAALDLFWGPTLGGPPPEHAKPESAP